MQTVNNIVAHIKGIIDGNNAEFEWKGMSDGRRIELEHDNKLLKSLVVWIEQPGRRDPDAFSSSIMK